MNKKEELAALPNHEISGDRQIEWTLKVMEASTNFMERAQKPLSEHIRYLQGVIEAKDKEEKEEKQAVAKLRVRLAIIWVIFLIAVILCRLCTGNEKLVDITFIACLGISVFIAMDFGRMMKEKILGVIAFITCLFFISFAIGTSNRNQILDGLKTLSIVFVDKPDLEKVRVTKDDDTTSTHSSTVPKD